MIPLSPPAAVVMASLTTFRVSPTRYGFTVLIQDTPRLRMVSAIDIFTASPRGFLPDEGFACWPVAEAQKFSSTTTIEPCLLNPALPPPAVRPARPTPPPPSTPLTRFSTPGPTALPDAP